jgi:hypothetical protein
MDASPNNQEPVAKPKASKPEMTQTALRVPPEVMDALDAWTERLNAKSHARWSRNAVILAVIERALRERGAAGEEP